MNLHTRALKLLAVRDHSIAELRRKLEAKGEVVPQELIDQLIKQNFLNDRRFAESYVAKRKKRGTARLKEELIALGIPGPMVAEILMNTDWCSLKQALNAKMEDWNLRIPLRPRDAARLFRALARLGFDEDAIREEIEQIYEQ